MVSLERSDVLSRLPSGSLRAGCLPCAPVRPCPWRILLVRTVQTRSDLVLQAKQCGPPCSQQLIIQQYLTLHSTAVPIYTTYVVTKQLCILPTKCIHVFCKTVTLNEEFESKILCVFSVSPFCVIVTSVLRTVHEMRSLNGGVRISTILIELFHGLPQCLRVNAGIAKSGHDRFLSIPLQLITLQ